MVDLEPERLAEAIDDLTYADGVGVDLRRPSAKAG